jgi:hypothetical protein
VCNFLHVSIERDFRSFLDTLNIRTSIDKKLKKKKRKKIELEFKFDPNNHQLILGTYENSRRNPKL